MLKKQLVIAIIVQKLCLISSVFGSANQLPSPPMCGVNPLDNRIVGGTVLSLDQHPWMALLDFELSFKGQSSFDYQCGGVLINSRYVLTAAHCLSETLQGVKRKLLAVRLGEHDLLQSPIDCEIQSTGEKECAAEPIDVNIEKIIRHPDYNSTTKFNDIALLRLGKSIDFTDSIKPVCLPTSSTPAIKTNSTLYAIGWGSTIAKNVQDSASSVKRIIGLRLWDHMTCRAKLNVQPTQICAGGEVNKDACLGDSGGPFLKQASQYWYIEGVISYGNGCGKADWPGVYTNVRAYTSWIKENLEP